MTEMIFGLCAAINPALSFSPGLTTCKKLTTKSRKNLLIGRRKTAILTREKTEIVSRRAAKMAIDEVFQGVRDKFPILKEIIDKYELTADNVCFVGDDINDLEAIEYAGIGVAVNDAAESVRESADYVTGKVGGNGAVREICEMILSSKCDGG